MKRSWIGFALLLVLLGGGLLSGWAMEEIHEPIAEHLEEAAERAVQKDWRTAAGLVAKARRDWEKWEGLRTCFADHGPLEEIDALFRELEVYGLRREEVAFAALCRGLAVKVEAVGEAHGVKWENLL